MCNLISAGKTVGFIFWRQLLTRTRWDLVDNPKQNPCRNVGVFYWTIFNVRYMEAMGYTSSHEDHPQKESHII